MLPMQYVLIVSLKVSGSLTKLFFMRNLTEHEIRSAHKCFHAQLDSALNSFCSNVFMHNLNEHDICSALKCFSCTT